MGFPENMTPNIYSSAVPILGTRTKAKQNKKKEKLGEGKQKTQPYRARKQPSEKENAYSAMLLTDCLLVDFIYCSFSERSVAILYHIYGIV